MSATGRGAIRHKHDEYVTPDWSIERLLERYTPAGPGTVWFDPCASRGELIATAQKLCPAGVRWIANELNPECAEALTSVCGQGACGIGDFLAMPPPAAPIVDVILTNPPYSKAEEFVEQSLRFARISVMLLRLNFLGGRDRLPFTQRTKPGILTLPNRPSFNGWGSDSCEYGWFVYGDTQLAGSWFPLNNTPEEQIERWNAAARLRYPDENPKLRKQLAAAAEQANP